MGRQFESERCSVRCPGAMQPGQDGYSSDRGATQVKTFISSLITWLISLFYEKKQMTDISTNTVFVTQPVAAAVAPQPTPTAITPTAIVQETPAQAVKAGVADFMAAFAFVKSGVAQLGDAAEEELKVLAQKYL